MNAIQEFLNPVYEVGAWGLELAFYATFFAALLAAIALAVNLLFRRGITAGQMNLLWALVLVRLMLPIAPPSSLSLQGAVVKLFDGAGEVANEAENSVVWQAEPRISKSNTADSNGKVIQAIHDEPPANAIAHPVPVSEDEPLWIEDAVSTVLFQFLLIWPCAAVGIILWTVFVNAQFNWKVNRTPFCRDERLASLWAACCQQAKIRRTIPIVLLEAVQQPAMMGVFHHRLLLPPDAMQLSDDELRMIMLHELAHARRCDIAINWALVFVRAVHWWNPIYWLAARRFAATREQACDAFVVRQLTGTSSRNYGELLLKLAEAMPGRSRWRVLVPTPILGFMLSAFRRRAIAGRLRALPRAAIARSRWHALAIGSATVLLAYCGLTDAKMNAPPPERTVDEVLFPMAFEQLDAIETIHPAADQTAITRDYDLTAVLATIAGENRTMAEARAELEDMIKWESEHVPALAPRKGRVASSPRVVGADDLRGNETTNVAEPPIEYKVSGQILSLTALAERHAEFAKLLRAWEQGGFAQVSILCRFVTMRSATQSTIDIPWRYLAPYSNSNDEQPLAVELPDRSSFRATVRVEEYAPLVYAVLTPEKTQAFLDEAQGSTGMNILQAPRPTCFNGEEVTLVDQTQRPFVVAVRETSPGVQTPRIAVESEGTKLQLRPIVRADGKSILLHSRAVFSGIEDVKEASMTGRSKGESTTIQVPRVKRVCIDIASEVPDGHSLLIGTSIERLDENRSVNGLFVLLTPNILKEQTEARLVFPSR
jgi:bla regulator protein blaR1